LSHYHFVRRKSHRNITSFYSRTVPLDIIKVFYLPTDALKRILKFTLTQVLHVSVQSPSSGSVLFELAKDIVVKIIN